MATEAKLSKIMTEPLPQILAGIEDSIRAAYEAAEDARKAALEARRAGEQAASIAQIRAEEAATKAAAALPSDLVKKVLSSWNFLAFIVLVVLASVVGSVAISLGLFTLFP